MILQNRINPSNQVCLELKGSIIKQQLITGYEGQYLWDTRKVENGIYLYVLKNDKGETLTSGKVSILK
jgi:hypothetical protein